MRRFLAMLPPWHEPPRMRLGRAMLWGCAMVSALATLANAAPVDVLRPHLDTRTGAATVDFGGQRFINHGLVGVGRLAASTIDFMGDTLGSFSSLQIAPHSWRRVGDHYEALLWTLPDRGRNDPGSGLFYDYAGRLNHFQIQFAPYQGADLPALPSSQDQLRLTVDGGLCLSDEDGMPFTGADPGAGSRDVHGVLLPTPTKGLGAGKLSLDAESLQFTRDGGFYVGDEYAANVYYFGADGRLRGIITPPPAIVPRRGGLPDFSSLEPPQSGRRNNQGVEGMALSPDGQRLFVALQSALIQDSTRGANASGRVYIRVLVYDVSRGPLPSRPIGHYVLRLPAYRDLGDGLPADRTAAQSEIRALNQHQFLMLARDAHGLGSDNWKPMVYKSVLLVDTDGASNLAGSVYEDETISVLRGADDKNLKTEIKPLRWVELVNLLNPPQLARFGLNLRTFPKNQRLTLSDKWEAMDLVPTLLPGHPDDYFLLVGNDNDFISRFCLMQGQRCDASFDNDNMILVYRLTLPSMQAPAAAR